MGRQRKRSLERRRQKLLALVEDYKSQSALTIGTASEWVLAHSPAEQRAGAQLLAEVAGRVRTDTVKALEQRLLSAPLVPPPARLAGKQQTHSLPQRGRRPAYAAPAAMVADVEAALAEVRKQQPSQFSHVLEQLGSPSATEFAALFQRPALWGVLEKAGQGGQVNVLVGKLFEERRKSAPEFAAAERDADRVRRAVNDAIRKQRVHGSAAISTLDPGAAGPALREEFGPPVFYDNVLDGEGKQLSDGLRAAWNADQQILVMSFDEAKFGKRGQEQAPAQQDAVLRRVLERGMIVGRDSVPPERIHLAIHSGAPGARSTQLTAYFAGSASGFQITPSGYLLKVVGVPAHGLRDFAKAFLTAWNKRVMSRK